MAKILERIIKPIIRNGAMRFYYRIRNNEEKSVYFSSFSGKQYSDNPRAISELLHKKDSCIKLIWKAEKNIWHTLPSYVIPVLPGSLEDIRLQAQSDVWVMNAGYSKKDGYYKGSKIFYIQTWHGDRGFKKIGWAAFKAMGEHYHGVHNLPDLTDCNLYLSASNYGDRRAHEGFLYSGEILKCGLPRNDKLVHIENYEKEIESVKLTLGINEKSKILLYAPTFRDFERGNEKCFVNIDEVLKILDIQGEDWICLIRKHSSSHGINYVKGNGIVDVSNYPDMSDLLMIADMLITDYSSCAGDFVLKNKPCILAQFDYDSYCKESRQLWIDPVRAGFLVAYSQEQLNAILEKIGQMNIGLINKNILSAYGTVETGKSTSIVVDRILNWIKEVG